MIEMLHGLGRRISFCLMFSFRCESYFVCVDMDLSSHYLKDAKTLLVVINEFSRCAQVAHRSRESRRRSSLRIYRIANVLVGFKEYELRDAEAKRVYSLRISAPIIKLSRFLLRMTSRLVVSVECFVKYAVTA